MDHVPAHQFPEHQDLRAARAVPAFDEAPDGPDDLVVEIVHLADLHLYLAARRADPAALAADLEDYAPEQVYDLRDPTGETSLRLRRLHELIRALAAHGEGPLVVVQAGDIEHYGVRRDGRWPSIEHLFLHEWPSQEASGVHHVDVYGNHDIWRGNWFDVAADGGHQGRPEVLASTFPELAGPWAETTVPGPSGTAVFHRVDTVEPRRVPGRIMAHGCVRPEPCADPATAPPPDDRLREAMTGDDHRAIHVVVSHHPLERVQFRGGWLINANRIQFTQGAHKVRDAVGQRTIFMSGHVHRMHPEIGEPPLAPRQLIAPSPTKPPFLKAMADHRAAPVYRLRLPPDGVPTVDRQTLVWNGTDWSPNDAWEVDVLQAAKR